MKKISEHLGQIIVALACVALLISAVVLFKAPIGDFYDRIVNKEVAVGNKVVDAIDNTDISGMFGKLSAPTISITDNVLTIEPVENAVAYEVYNGEDLLTTTSSNSVDLLQFFAGQGTYTLGVKAVGNGQSPSAVSSIEWIAPNVIPANATYYVGVTSTTTGDYTGATSILTAGDPFPTTSNQRDVYVYGDYEYRYRYEGGKSSWSSVLTDGWGVAAIDKTQCSYSVILQSINGKPITSTKYTFYNCTSLVSLPDGFTIPDGVTGISQMFYKCVALTSLPDGFTIPNGVTNVSAMFDGCKVLTNLPDGFTIPNGVTDVSAMFSGCKALTNLPDGFTIPDGVTGISQMFSSCEALTNLPDDFTIPNGVTNVSAMFSNCKDLTGLPAGFTIPSSVTTLNSLFYGCSALTNLPSGFTIPSDATNVNGMFNGCEALTGLPDSFTIPEKVTNVQNMFRQCKALTGNVKIDADPTSYSGCFSETSNPITITGSCSSETKANLAGTGGSNITY